MSYPNRHYKNKMQSTGDPTVPIYIDSGVLSYINNVKAPEKMMRHQKEL